MINIFLTGAKFAAPITWIIFCFSFSVIIVAQKLWSLIFVGLSISSSANAGPIAAGICYAGCAAVTVACFSAAGFTFGTVPGALIAATPVVAACNAAFGICEASFITALIVPVP